MKASTYVWLAASVATIVASLVGFVAGEPIAVVPLFAFALIYARYWGEVTAAARAIWDKVDFFSFEETHDKHCAFWRIGSMTLYRVIDPGETAQYVVVFIKRGELARTYGDTLRREFTRLWMSLRTGVELGDLQARLRSELAKLNGDSEGEAGLAACLHEWLEISYEEVRRRSDAFWAAQSTSR